MFRNLLVHDQGVHQLLHKSYLIMIGLIVHVEELLVICRVVLLHSRSEQRVDDLGLFTVVPVVQTLLGNCFMQRLMYSMMMDQ
jgi:hypothetical protein